ncbi:MAG: hypothetical protein ABWY77_03825 [Acidimicrobiia bacterium]
MSAFNDDAGDKLASPISIALLSPGEDAWRTVAAPPGVGDVYMWDALCAGDKVLIVDRELENLWMLALDGTWTALPDAPRELAHQPLPAGANPRPGYQMPVLFSYRSWTGNELILWSDESLGTTQNGVTPTLPGYAIALAPGSGEWTTAAPGPGLDRIARNYIWTDGYAFALTGAADGLHLVTYRPR